MGLFSKIFTKKELTEYGDEQLVAVTDGRLITAGEINDEVFSQEMMGQTIGFELENNKIVSPCNGKVEVMFSTGHAFAVRMTNGQGILVHIGINTVKLGGKGFKVFAKEGDMVKAGQKLVEVDTNLVKDAGYELTTMLIVTEPAQEGYKENFIECCTVKRGQIINNNKA